MVENKPGQKSFEHIIDEHPIMRMPETFGGKDGLLDHFKVEPVPVVQETTEPIQFDLEKYNTCKYDVVTRIGLPIRILATDRNYGSSPIFALVLRGEELARTFDINGICYQEADHNLFLVAKTETVWKNMFESSEYDCKEKAEINGKYGTLPFLKFIETIEITRPIK